MCDARWVGMAAQGADVVFGDLDDIDSLRRGFKGAYGVYGITDCECCSVASGLLCPFLSHPVVLLD